MEPSAHNRLGWGKAGEAAQIGETIALGYHRRGNTMKDGLAVGVRRGLLAYPCKLR
jgi:hypothetical protein